MANDNLFKPGETVTVSGQYELIGQKGGKTKLEITAVQGKQFPPTPKPGMKFKLVDKTKHKK